MNKLNIWIATSEFPPIFGGGISTYCWEAGVAWSSSGHNVKIFTRSASPYEELNIENPRSGLAVVRFPVKSEGKVNASLGYWHLLSYCLAENIIKQIRDGEIRPDIIEVQDYGALAYYLLKSKLNGLSELADTKVIIYCHTPVFELSHVNQEASYLFPNYWIGQCEKFCLRAADAVISPSEFLKTRLQSYTQKPIDVIPYPYFGETEDRVAELASVNTEYDLVYVGRLEYRKGVLHLLKSMKKLWDAGRGVRLRMVGGDTYWAPKQTSIKALIEKGYSSYISKGWLTLDSAVPPDQLVQIFKSAKCVVIPSIYENFPYVCMQAMDLACPVLGSESGGHSELIGSEGLYGEVFSWSVNDNFDLKLSKILSLKDDERQALGKRGRFRLRELCSYETFITCRRQHYNNIPNVEIHEYPFDHQLKVLSNGSHADTYGISGVEGLLSVVIPFYNLGLFLEEALTSVSMSDYSPIEIIVINDGSTDQQSIDVLEKLKQQNRTNIRIIDIPNAGLANARNIGAQNAFGEFVAFLDADDTVKPMYYSKCVDLLKRYKNVSFVYSWVQYFGESNDLWVNFDTEFPYFLAGNMLAAFQVVRRSDFLTYGINDSEMMFGMEDYEAWMRMASYGKLGVSIHEPLVNYRVRHNSMAREFRRSTILYMYEQIAQKNPEIYSRYGKEIFLLLNANGPGYLWNNPTLNYPSLGFLENAPSPMIGSRSDESLSMGEQIRLKNLLTVPIFLWVSKIILRWNLDLLLRRKV
ncbi:MAG: glycosyltransferase [Gammaproteobacteria bacterium]|nr:MAG: glycosyltransferase [Gammaproteobacteria bacterium]